MLQLKNLMIQHTNGLFKFCTQKKICIYFVSVKLPVTFESLSITVI